MKKFLEELLQFFAGIVEGLLGVNEVPPASKPEVLPPPKRKIPNDPGRIGRQIVDYEARRDSNGHLKLYFLPDGDGGGTSEIAGLNDKYHPEILEQLKTTPPSDREDIAAAYIEDYTRKGTGLTEPTGIREGTLLFVLDSAFNRGPAGAAWIVQDAMIALGHRIAKDRQWGPATLGALKHEDQQPGVTLLNQLRKSRQRYEIEIVIPRHPKGSRDKFWNGLVNRWTKVLQQSKEWNQEEPRVVPAEPVPRVERPAIITGHPDTIYLPRESTSALNAFYGTANKAGSYNEWFQFPVDDIVFYKRGGTGLKDRDGDGRDEHRCHGLVVDRLEAAFQELFSTLGKARFYEEGWHIYGGCFNYRYKTGGSSLSTHSWAIAIDQNPNDNGWKQYSTSFSDEAMDIMEKHGWLSAYRAWGHDAMHWQQCIPRVVRGSYYDRHGLPDHIKEA